MLLLLFLMMLEVQMLSYFVLEHLTRLQGNNRVAAVAAIETICDSDASWYEVKIRDMLCAMCYTHMYHSYKTRKLHSDDAQTCESKAVYALCTACSM